MKHPDTYTDSRYFYTSSLYLAAFLYAHGQWLSNAEKDEEGKYCFAFRESPEREALVRLYRQGAHAMVDARTFVCAVQDLQRRTRLIRQAAQSE